MRFFIILLSLVLLLAGTHAFSAKRFGGGKSFGHQSSNVTKRETQRSNHAAPANPSQMTPSAPVPAQAKPKRPWGAMLGGLAAGIGLAWLASKLGLGAAMANALLIVLLVIVVIAVISFFMRKRVQQENEKSAYHPFATPQPTTNMPASYSVEHVGNDASARPWEQSLRTDASATPGAGGSMIGSGLSGSQTWGIPADFDVAGFIASAKSNFLKMQKAYDHGDLQILRLMLTPEMFAEINQQIITRDPFDTAKTEVTVLEAVLLGIETLPTEYVASVEFTGATKDAPASSATPFREVWNLSKPIQGSDGWIVCGLEVMS